MSDRLTPGREKIDPSNPPIDRARRDIELLAGSKLSDRDAALWRAGYYAGWRDRERYE